MYQLAVVSLVLSIVAAFLGFTKIATVSVGGTFFFIFLAVAVVTALGGLYRGRRYSGR
jgi:uncharacterized membrane protein YtjA (UPF0391 family)